MINQTQILLISDTETKCTPSSTLSIQCSLFQLLQADIPAGNPNQVKPFDPFFGQTNPTALTQQSSSQNNPSSFTVLRVRGSLLDLYGKLLHMLPFPVQIVRIQIGSVALYE